MVVNSKTINPKPINDKRSFTSLFNPERIGKDPSGWMIAATAHVLTETSRAAEPAA
jgi:hypothetical protein